VDDDGSDNNRGVPNAIPSRSDVFFRALLAEKGIAFRERVVSGGGLMLADLASFTTVIWYTGDRVLDHPYVSEPYMTQWLNTGGKRLLLFAPETVRGSGTGLPPYGVAQSRDDCLLGHATLSGVTGQPTAGLTVPYFSAARVRATADCFTVAAGADALVTALAGSPLAPAAVAVGRRAVGTAATSTVVFAAFPLENVVGEGAARSLLDALWAY
jgi:hypothetical protein